VALCWALCATAPGAELDQDDIDELFVEITDMDEQDRDKTILSLCHMYDGRTAEGLAELLLMHKERSATGIEAMLDAGEDDDDDRERIVITDDIKEKVVTTLCYIAGDSLLPKLKEMIESEDETTARYGIRIAGYVGSPGSTAVLKKIASSGPKKLRLEAIRSLGNADNETAVPYLQEQFGESTGWMRSAARQALARLGIRAGVRGNSEVRERMEARRRVVCVGREGCSAWLTWTRHRLPATEFTREISSEPFTAALSESGLLYFALKAASVKGLGDAVFGDAAIRKAISKFIQDGGVLFFELGGLSPRTLDYLKSIGVTPPGSSVRDPCEAVRSEADRHPITEEPAPMDRKWGELDCAYAWPRWPSAFVAPYRSATNSSRAVLLLQEGVLGGGDVIFNQVNTLTRKSDKSYRMLLNLLTWYFGVVKIPARHFKMSPKIVTPHIKWAKPYHLGETKVVFALGSYGGRLPLEIAQRLECKFEFVPIIQEGGFYPTGHLEHQVVDRLRAALRNKPDALVVGVYEPANWEYLPKFIKEDIERRVVRGGMGLVILTKGESSELMDVLEGQKPVNPAFLQVGTPFEFDRGKCWGADLGKGRMLLVNTGIHKSRFGSAAIQSTFLFPSAYLRPGVWEDWSSRGPSEYLYAWLTKAVLWATHREPQVQITKLAPAKSAFSVTEKPSVNVHFTSRAADTTNLRVEVFVVDKYDREIARAESEVSVKGETDAAIQLPTLRDGQHLANVIARDAQGRTVTFAATPVRCECDFGVKEIRADQRFYDPPADIEGTIVLGGKSGQAQLSLRALDTYGRLLHEQQWPADQEERTFRFRLERPRSRLVELEAELKSGGRAISAMTKPVPVRLPQDRDYRWYLWGGHEPVAKILEKLGVDFCLSQPFGYSSHYLSEAWEKALRANHGYFAIGLDDMRSGCQSSVIHAARLKERVEGRARILIELTGAQDFMLGDEQELANTQCTEPSCLFLFRRQLRDTYGSLEKLNGSWQTDFKDWEDVVPMKPDEVAERESLAPYVDHMSYMDTVFSSRVADAQLQLREFQPEARVGYSGTQEIYKPGYDWWKLMKHISFICRYGGVHRELTRSFARPDLRMGQWCGGYTLSDRGEERTRWTVWFQFFHGCSLLAYYAGTAANLLGPDWTPNNVVTWKSEEVRDLKSGLAKLIMHSKWSHEGIAIHYSQPSIHVARLTTQKHNIRRPRRGIIPTVPLYMQLVEQLGLQYNFVSYEQVGKGELLKRGYRVFLMPMSQAVSEDEAREIQQFVKEGGTVIADYGPGIRDDHGAPAKADVMKDMFGLSFTAGGGRCTTLPAQGTGGLQPDEESETLATHIPSEVKALSAKPLGRVGDKPAVFVNSYGKGKAIYLNFLPSAGQRELLGKLLAMAGVEPRVHLRSGDSPVWDAELFFYQNGAAEYVGVLTGQSAPEELKISFPRASHLYRLRDRAYFGKVSEADVEITPRCAEVFATMPYRVDGLEVTSGDAFQPGEVMAYGCRVKPSEGEAGMHVFHVEVVDPDGTKHPEYSCNILAQDGTGKAEISLALNEKKGRWRIVATEVVSGKSAEKAFEVK